MNELIWIEGWGAMTGGSYDDSELRALLGGRYEH